MAGAAASVLDQLSQLLPNQIHHFPDSNAWAANGPAVAGASADQPRALLGGDPHLPQTLPSVWYEVALSAPGYQVGGGERAWGAGHPARAQRAYRLVAD